MGEMDQKTPVIFYLLTWKTDNSKTQQSLSSKWIMNVNECSELQWRARARWLYPDIMCQRCWVFHYMMGLNTSKQKHSPCVNNYWEMEQKNPSGVVFELAAPHWYLGVAVFRLDGQCVCLGCFRCQWPFHTRVRQQSGRANTKTVLPVCQAGQLWAQGAGLEGLTLPGRMPPVPPSI